MAFPKKSLALFLLLGLCGVAACQKAQNLPGDEPAEKSLVDARRGFTTKLVRKVRLGVPADEPPEKLFQLIHYPSPAGSLAAYVGVRPPDSAKHPAIIWIIGGFSNSISDIAWTPGPRDNDQSASAFRKAGIVMMYPSLRGGNDNPGAMETFYGEVDDVLAAADYLAKLEYVDPQRIYLGGHSTGGTLAMLAAECSDRFRTVFAFGPVDDVEGYGNEVLPFDTHNRREFDLRAPGKWLTAIRNPTFVIEGTRGGSNIASLHAMSRKPHGAHVHFLEAAGADHFGTLFPLTRLLAQKIVKDTGETPNITLTSGELANAIKGK